MKQHALTTLALALLYSCAAPSCAQDDHDDHAHPHEGHGEHADAPPAPKSDAHHVAERRTSCEDDVELSAEAVARYGIAVEAAREMALVPRVSAPGHLAFPQGAVARVGCAVEGRVVELHARSGDAVARGDTLLVVESPAFGAAQSDYLLERSLAATSGPAVELARGSLERARELHERVQGISLAEVERREAELRTAERERDVAQAREAAAKNRLLLAGMDDDALRALESTRKIAPRVAVRAPIDGKVVEVSATLGELVGPDKDRLVVVGDLRTLWAIAEISETHLSEIALGAAASVRVPALGRAPSTGTVSAVPTVLEPGTRTAEVRIEVPNPDGALLPGMFLQIEIDSARGSGAPVLAVPDGAVLTVEGHASVFVPIAPGASVFCRHEVEVGTAVGEHVPVLAGLVPGELVVVAGTFRLKAELGKASAQHEH